MWNLTAGSFTNSVLCNGVQREHNKKLNNGLPILHKVPPKRDYNQAYEPKAIMPDSRFQVVGRVL